MRIMFTKSKELNGRQYSAGHVIELPDAEPPR
jgi:hypothetical protein